MGTGRTWTVERRRLAAGAVLVALAAAALASPGDVRAAPLAPVAAPSYKGTWFGATGQDREIDFTVDRKNKLTLLKLSFEIEGDGCSVEVEKTVRGTVATIRKKAFRVKRQTAQDSFTLTGRFTSRTAARGKLTGSFGGNCAGTVETTWTARKGKRPPVDRSRDGTWEGPLTLPGIDPGILATLGGVSFEVEDGRLRWVELPAVTRGTGCVAIRIPGLGASFEPPVPVVEGAFSAEADAGIGWSFAVAGSFGSATSASGTVSITGRSGVAGVPGYCAGTVEGTWEATKQAASASRRR